MSSLEEAGGGEVKPKHQGEHSERRIALSVHALSLGLALDRPDK
jgi:hypothetical protein